MVLAWLPPAGLAPRGRGCWVASADGFCIGFDVGCVCVISYLLSRYMRPYRIMTAAGFSYMTISRPGPALPILTRHSSPSPQSARKNKQKDKIIEHSVRDLCSSTPQPLWRGLELRFRLPSSRRGPQRRVFRCRGRRCAPHSTWW